MTIPPGTRNNFSLLHQGPRYAALPALLPISSNMLFLEQTRCRERADGQFLVCSALFWNFLGVTPKVLKVVMGIKPPPQVQKPHTIPGSQPPL